MSAAGCPPRAPLERTYGTSPAPGSRHQSATTEGDAPVARVDLPGSGLLSGKGGTCRDGRRRRFDRADLQCVSRKFERTEDRIRQGKQSRQPRPSTSTRRGSSPAPKAATPGKATKQGPEPECHDHDSNRKYPACRWFLTILAGNGGSPEWDSWSDREVDRLSPKPG